MRKRCGTWMAGGVALCAAVIAGCMTTPGDDNQGGDQGEVLTFMTNLSGGEEVPPVETAATGTFSMAVNSDTGAGTYTATFTGLSGPVTSAHLHLAAAGQNGAPFEDISGDFAGDDDGNVQGSFSLTAGEIADIQAGNVYVNLHTEANGAGEIRGQLGAM